MCAKLSTIDHIYITSQDYLCACTQMQYTRVKMIWNILFAYVKSRMMFLSLSFSFRSQHALVLKDIVTVIMIRVCMYVCIYIYIYYLYT